MAQIQPDAIMLATKRLCVPKVYLYSYSYFIQKANDLHVLQSYKGDSTFNWNMNLNQECVERSDSQADKNTTAGLGNVECVR
jgi:hypothetical protein